MTTPSAAGQDAALQKAIECALARVVDPELRLNIVETGLVYKIEVSHGVARVEMTLTSPACPFGPQILADAQKAVEAVEGVREAQVRLVWTPPWTPERMQEDARMKLGLI